MRTKNLFIPAVGCLLGFVAIAPAIFREKDSRLGVETLEWLMSGDIGRGMGRPVTGAPFSAQVIVENTRTLANGVHISEKSTGALYRDTEGRVRHEKPRDGNPEIAIVDDPVAGVQYRLHLFQHTFTQTSYKGGETANNPEIRERRKAEEVERAMKTAHEANTQNNSREALSEPRTESLGAQMIEGVQAQGQRSTRTVPAGAMGNDKQFDVVQETWYSPSLQMVLMFKMSNPARGDLVMRLANISQGEPSHSLFEPPSDFTAAENSEGSRK